MDEPTAHQFSGPTLAFRSKDDGTAGPPTVFICRLMAQDEQTDLPQLFLDAASDLTDDLQWKSQVKSLITEAYKHPEKYAVWWAFKEAPATGTTPAYMVDTSEGKREICGLSLAVRPENQTDVTRLELVSVQGIDVGRPLIYAALSSWGEAQQLVVRTPAEDDQRRKRLHRLLGLEPIAAPADNNSAARSKYIDVGGKTASDALTDFPFDVWQKVAADQQLLVYA